ncbi:MAG: hypothetical protein CM15mP104_0060 [Gammaproteobacteria bacterium]|nr:MAG: hypothetical protein CM15mP104_0060 [Gammaproteobacteria bacterium]
MVGYKIMHTTGKLMFFAVVYYTCLEDYSMVHQEATRAVMDIWDEHLLNYDGRRFLRLCLYRMAQMSTGVLKLLSL